MPVIPVNTNTCQIICTSSYQIPHTHTHTHTHTEREREREININNFKRANTRQYQKQNQHKVPSLSNVTQAHSTRRWQEHDLSDTYHTLIHTNCMLLMAGSLSLSLPSLLSLSLSYSSRKFCCGPMIDPGRQIRIQAMASAAVNL